MVKSRRFVLGALGILSLLVLGLYTKDSSVAMPIATICVGIAGANAYQGKGSGYAAQEGNK